MWESPDGIGTERGEQHDLQGSDVAYRWCAGAPEVGLDLESSPTGRRRDAATACQSQAVRNSARTVDIVFVLLLVAGLIVARIMRGKRR